MIRVLYANLFVRCCDQKARAGLQIGYVLSVALGLLGKVGLTLNRHQKSLMWAYLGQVRRLMDHRRVYR